VPAFAAVVKNIKIAKHKNNDFIVSYPIKINKNYCGKHILQYMNYLSSFLILTKSIISTHNSQKPPNTNNINPESIMTTKTIQNTIEIGINDSAINTIATICVAVL
jgi:sulfatase maturation enzyme AslB (radical SAM superfamily)